MLRISPWGIVEDLVAAPHTPPRKLEAEIARLGLRPVCDAILEEFAARCLPIECSFPISVSMGVRLGHDKCTYRILFADGDVQVHASDDLRSDVCLLWEAAELVTGFYNPDPMSEPDFSFEASWEERLVERASSAAVSSNRARDIVAFKRIYVRRAVSAIVDALMPAGVVLGTRMTHYGSDKTSGPHWYGGPYQVQLEKFRNQSLRLLEIGIGGYSSATRGGASLNAWADYFRGGLIYGLDCYPKDLPRHPRIRTVVGDQADCAFLRDLGRQCGPFDIVIDDGSHRASDTTAAFGELFPFVTQGGLYVIEDLQTSYWPLYGGGSDTEALTAIEMLKTIIDEIHADEVVLPSDPQHVSEWTAPASVSGMSVYRNLAFIHKGNNRQGGAKWPWERSFGDRRS